MRSILALAAAALALAPAAQADSLRAQTQRTDPCLARLVDLEGSGWNPRTWNRGGSGAYGLPQALPGSKMASAGRDWATNAVTQLRWMRGYVNGRYGGSCSALSYWYAHRWY